MSSQSPIAQLVISNIIIYHNLCRVAVLNLFYRGDFINCRDCHGVDMYAGSKGFTTSMSELGRVVLPFENKDDAEGLQNILTDGGITTLVRHAMRCRPGSVSSVGVVCSTWLWICKASTGRHIDPMGYHATSRVVAEANAMVSRTILIIMLLSCLRSCWILEQPGDSCMHEHTRFKFMRQLFAALERRSTASFRFKIQYVYTWMGMFGHPCCKGSFLWGTPPWTFALKRKMSKERKAEISESLTYTTHDEFSGKKKVYGRKDTMKRSQEYPKGYTDCLAMHYINNEADFNRRMLAEEQGSSSESDYSRSIADSWGDCELESWYMPLQQMWVDQGPGFDV